MALPAMALNGSPGIHDPSTVIECDGKYYAFGTGGNGIMSEDGGWTWHGGAVRPGGGVAPDAIHIGDRYLVSYGGGGGIHTMWSKTLDPNSPDLNFQDDTLVAPGDMDCNPIDPAFLLDPTTGKLWLTYGSYVGYIRLLELDPKTAKPVAGATPLNIAINCEASCMIYHDGWYYLLATHGSCCQQGNSGYRVVVGRSQKVTGPFIDNMGIDMIKGGGKLFCGSEGRWVGPGHFGLIASKDEAAQKWSCHYELDMDRGGSVLDIRPVLWQDGWPVAGDNLVAGTYEIQSVRTGTSLELAVEPVAVGGGRRGGGRGAGGRGGGGGGFGNGAPAGGAANVPGGQIAQVPAVDAAGAAGAAAPTNGGGRRAGRGGGGGGFGFGGGGGPVPDQDVAQVSVNWPKGNIDPRMANYMCQAQQKWAFTAVPDVGGYLGSPFFKITIAGTDRALAATADEELTTVPEFTGAPEQLWQVDELTDGTWRIMPKAVPGSKERPALSAIGSKFATLAAFDPKSDRQRWLLKKP